MVVGDAEVAAAAANTRGADKSFKTAPAAGVESRAAVSLSRADFAPDNETQMDRIDKILSLCVSTRFHLA